LTSLSFFALKNRRQRLRDIAIPFDREEDIIEIRSLMFLAAEISRGDDGIRRVNLRGNYSSGKIMASVNLKGIMEYLSITTERSVIRHDIDSNGIDKCHIFVGNDRTRNTMIEL